jgi:hypothetical protein
MITVPGIMSRRFLGAERFLAAVLLAIAVSIRAAAAWEPPRADGSPVRQTPLKGLVDYPPHGSPTLRFHFDTFPQRTEMQRLMEQETSGIWTT